MGFGYGTEYGALIIFTGISAFLGWFVLGLGGRNRIFPDGKMRWISG
jgi:hypothetical protein